MYQKPHKITTETVEHRSYCLNYGKPTPLKLYVVWCPICGKECSTGNVLDGEEKAGTIQKEDANIYLHFGRCKDCLWEYYF